MVILRIKIWRRSTLILKLHFEIQIKTNLFLNFNKILILQKLNRILKIFRPAKWLQFYQMTQPQSHQHVLTIPQIVQKLYQNRLPSEHRQLINFLSPLFPTLSSKMLKLISFYLVRIFNVGILSNKDFSSQSFVIVADCIDVNPEGNAKLYTISKQKKVCIQNGQFGLVLEFCHYLNCQALGESSIEDQIAFMHTSQFLCSIPKKRLYQILKKSTVVKYSFSQTVFTEGQKIQIGESGSGVYIIRKGDFGYFKYSQKQQKQIQVMQFSKGHLFGMLQIGDNSSKILSQNSRQFTVRCKNHEGLVYRFSQQLYLSHVKPFCEQIINTKQSKLTKYIDGLIQKSNEIREMKKPLLSQTMRKRFSLTNTSQKQQFPLLGKTSLFTTKKSDFFTQKPSLSQQIQEEGLRKTNYFSLTKEGPLKKYPMTSQRANFTESEFREFVKLEKDKEACNKIRQLSLTGKSSVSKGQILFTFFKKTWNFDKEKKQKSQSQRYQ